MITLLTDGLIAAVNLIDRGLTAVENVWLRETPPVPVEPHTPTGEGCDCAVSADPGGHPDRSTSQILNAAAAQLVWAYNGVSPAIVRDLLAEMRDRAAQFAALND